MHTFHLCAGSPTVWRRNAELTDAGQTSSVPHTMPAEDLISQMKWLRPRYHSLHSITPGQDNIRAIVRTRRLGLFRHVARLDREVPGSSILAISCDSTLCLKKFPPLDSLQLCQILTDFQNFCTAEKRMKFSTNPYDNAFLTWWGSP